MIENLKIDCTPSQLVEKMVLENQTELVEMLLMFVHGGDIYEDDWETGNYAVDEDGEYPTIIAWRLINPWYRDIIKAGDKPWFEIKGELWLGCDGSQCPCCAKEALSHWPHLKDLCLKAD